MSKKSVMSLMLVLFLSTWVLKAQTSSNIVVDVILKGYEPKLFTTKPVTDSELDWIIKCGMKAPSARNGQPWKFTVIKDIKLIQDIIPKFETGNILIIISGSEFPPAGSNVDIDCAIATESMYIAAQGLGLGGQIYTAQAATVNTSKKEAFEIPIGYKVITLLRVGNFDNTVDAVTAASPRKTLGEVVNYKK
jgi:nitroreductase